MLIQYVGRCPARPCKWNRCGEDGLQCTRRMLCVQMLEKAGVASKALRKEGT